MSVAALALLAVAACGGPTQQEPAKPAAPAQAPAAAPAKPAEPAKPAAQPAKPAAQPAKPAAAKPAAPAGAGVTDQMRAAAKQEGQVNYYTANATGGANKIKEEAEKALGIKVNVIRLSSSLLFNRVMQEFDSNVHEADIVETSLIEHFLDFKKKNMLQPFVPTRINQFRSKDYYDPDHHWHAGSVSLGAINYNKDLVKGDMIPKTWKELTAPKYKDKLIQGHIKASGTTAVLTYHLVQLYGWEYFEGLKRNNILTQQSCDSTNQLASGERVIALCDHQITTPAKGRGLPIETAFPEDGVFTYLRPIAVMAKAKHPNAAKLFIDWVFSPEGAMVYAQHNGLASPLDAPDVKYPADFPDMSKLKLMLVGPEEFGKWFPQGRDKFSEIFGG
jgi:iron(III) transport system substrate-binding protein